MKRASFPIHVASLGVAEVRFFRPVNGSAPWCPLADVWRAAGVPRDVQCQLEQAWRQGPYPFGAEEISPLGFLPVMIAADVASLWIGRHSPERFLDFAVATAKASRLLSGDKAPHDEGGSK